MKVGIVTTWFDRGAGVVSKQIMDVLKSEHDVYIYARGEKYEIGNPEWDLDCVHWGERVYWPGSGKIDREDYEGWLQDNKIEVVIFNEQRWWQPILWAKNLGVVAGAYVDYYTKENLSLFEVYDFLICNTEKHYKAFSWHPGAFLVKWGTNVDLFSPGENWSSYGNDLHDNTVTFFHSAGMAPSRKGTDILIEAFREVPQYVDCKLIIHSQRELPYDISDLDNVEVIVKTVSAPGLYYLGDVYVYPSRLDGLGLTVCEALACGLPVIVPDAEPMSEFVQDGVTGSLVRISKKRIREDGYYWPMEEVDHKELAKKIEEMANCKSNSLLEMKQAARQYAVDQRNWSENAIKILNILNSSSLKPVTKSMQKKVNCYDYKGLKGSLDYLISVPVLRECVEFVVKQHRKRKQPYFYSY